MGPTAARIEEDRALDTGDSHGSDGQVEASILEDREAPLLVEQSDAGARHRVARVAPKSVRSAERGEGALADEGVGAYRVSGRGSRSDVPPVVHGHVDLFGGHALS